MKKINLVAVLLVVALICGLGRITFALEINSPTLSAAATNYKYIEPITVETSNELINYLIANNWSAKKLEEKIGKPDNYLDGYYIYSDKGISIKLIGNEPAQMIDGAYYTGDNKIINICFNKKYTFDIIKGVNINSTKDVIFKKLGVPQFESVKIFGYKTKDYYLLFFGRNDLDEILIYKIDKVYDKTLIKDILSLDFGKYSASGMALNRWPDWDRSQYNSSGTGGWDVDYLSRGISIDHLEGNYKEKITIYNNFIGDLTNDITFPNKNKVEKAEYFDSQITLKGGLLEIKFALDKDLVFENAVQKVGLIAPNTNYNYIDPLNVETTNELINLLIANNWSSKRLEEKIGKTKSYFRGYFIYLDKGIFVRQAGEDDLSMRHSDNQELGKNMVAEICFSSKYKQEIIKDISTESAKDEIINKLGKPQFEKNGCFGYKTKNYYVFFMLNDKGNQISICRRDIDYDKQLIKDIIKNFDQQSADDSALTRWPDWDTRRYYRGVTGWDIDYYSKGIKVNHYGGDNYNTLIIYNNFIGDLTDEIVFPNRLDRLFYLNNIIKREKGTLTIEFCLDKDLVFENVGRVGNYTWVESEGGKLSPGRTKKIVGSGEAAVCSEVGFIICYLNNEKPPFEINLGSWETGPIEWLDDRYLIYWKFSSIYIFDTLRNTISSVDTADSDIRIISIDNGKIVYKVGYSWEAGKSYTISYSFDKNGEIILSSPEPKNEDSK